MLPSDQPETVETAPVRVSFVYPGDCLGDFSYCDVIYNGAQKAKMAPGVEVTEMESNFETWDMPAKHRC